MTTHSHLLAWEIPWTEEPVAYSPQGQKELDMTELTLSLYYNVRIKIVLINENIF